MMTNNYKPFIGGVPISIERLTTELRELGHEVTVFAPSYEGEEPEENVIRYHSLKRKVRGEYIIPNVLDPIIEESFARMSFDLIHVHHPMLIGYVAQYLGKKYNIPVVLTYHTRYEQYLHYLKFFGKRPVAQLEVQKKGSKTRNRRWLAAIGGEKLVAAHNRLFLNKCNLVFAPSESMRNYLLENGIVTDTRVVPTGILKEEFDYEPWEVERIRRNYAGDSKYLFCSVSRLEREKNIEFLLEGLREFKTRKGDCFKVLLIGDGGRKQMLKEEAIRLGLEQNIIFCGNIPHDQLRNYYRACDAFLFASTSETQGIVLLEAMAAGLPVIAVEASGVRDVVVNGRNGYMSENKVRAWTDKLILLTEEESMVERMQRNALEDASQYLSANIARKVQKYYQDVLYQRRMEPEYEYQNSNPVTSWIIPHLPKNHIPDWNYRIKE